MVVSIWLTPAHPIGLPGQTTNPTLQAMGQQCHVWPFHPNPRIMPLTLPQQPPSKTMLSMQQNIIPPQQSSRWGTSQTAIPSSAVPQI